MRFLDSWLELTPAERLVKWEQLPESKREIVRVEARRIQRLLEYPYPSALGQAIENETFIRTPMIELLDEKMLGVADAIRVMQKRQKRRRELLRDGVDDKVAIEQAALEIPGAGITRLIVSAPPQEGKSWEITRFGIEWLLVYYPWLKVAIVSYDMPTAGKFSYDIREDITTHVGQDGAVDLGLRLAKDQRAINRWTLQSRGGVFSVGITGGITSRHIDAMVIDDAVKDIRAAESILQAQQAAGWWQTSGRTRLSPWAPVIVVMTAWDEHDLRGQLIAKARAAREAGIEEFDDWDVLNIPAQADYDPSKGESDPLGRKVGEYLQSSRGRTIADWEATKFEATVRHWNAMYQGNPTPSLGNILKRSWWRRYDEPIWTAQLNGSFLVKGGWALTQSWDLKFGVLSGGPSSDYVAGQVWAKKGADSYLVYQVHARLSFVETIEAIRRVSSLFPQAKRKFVEYKANGPAVFASLKHEIPGLIKSEPKTSKEARAEASTWVLESGNIFIPTQRLAQEHRDLVFDADGFIDEATGFPFGAHDDQVDAFTQYVKEIYIDRGTAKIHSPVGRGPSSKPPAPEKSLMARRIAARAKAS